MRVSGEYEACIPYEYLRMISPSTLVIDHSAFRRSITVDTVIQSGCPDVLEAEDGTRALAVLQEHGAVDVVLCDLTAPGGDLFAFLQGAAHLGHVRAVITTGNQAATLGTALKRALQLLGLEWLGDVGRPVQPEQLSALLRRYAPGDACHLPRAVFQELPSEEAVRRALAQGEFFPCFQPKFDLRSLDVAGVEVLARWQTKQGTISPSTFLPVIRRCGLLDELLFELMRQSLSLARRWTAGALSLAFNLEASQLSAPDFADRVMALLSAHTVTDVRVTFELTEYERLQAPLHSLTNLMRLKLRGCGLSMDDFGAGYSSLQRLCQLPFDEVKLDACFIRNLDEGPGYAAAMHHTLALARSLGMRVVVEGVESALQHQKLLAMGCDVVQGYFYAPPLMGEDLLTLLQHQQTPANRLAHQFRFA